MNARLTSVGLMIAFWLAGPIAHGGEPTNARVIRIFLPEENTSGASRVSVSGTNILGLAAMGTFLTNESVRPKEADIVIVDRAYVPRLAGPYSKRLISLCETSLARLCFYHPSPGDPAIDSVLVVHWISPFEFPRNHKQTSYFVEGRFLGIGDTGMTNVLKELATKKPKAVMFAGSRYTDGKQYYAPGEVPYNVHWEERLNETLLTNNIRKVFPGYYLF